MDGEMISKISKWIYKYLFWIFLIISLLLILFSVSEIVDNSKINSIVQKLGLAVFSSGVFAAVLKSIQFTGLFKEEIEKVMLDTEFVKNRRDLPQLWRSISQIIYKRKFPQISTELEDRILSTYFPTSVEYYYLDYIVTINVEEITESFDLIYTQTCKYKVILDEGVKKTQLNLSSSINQDADAAQTINNLVFFRVNGKDNTPMEDQETIEDEFVKKFTVPLSGEKQFNIHSKFNRKYSLKNENYKLFRMNTFTKNMDVVISFPKYVSVSFFNIGNVTKFERQHIEIKNQIVRSHRNDVILPHQGFGMSFEVDPNKR